MICGKQCSVAPVGKIFLRHLDKNWKTEYVVTMLEKAGIEKIDKVNRKKKSTVATLEFGTSEDAQFAFNKLRKKDAFGKNLTVEVEWAKPDEEENLNVIILRNNYFFRHCTLPFFAIDTLVWNTNM
ncbi:hypothetical protein CASFOL_029518 [Castilleja foliolosa]|uniref:RRM domain-containing protein n=1 Tax=Castilleja foliolosa TaxID=1961234 RepID=A0ABD3C9A7_9LAMI